MRKKKQGAAPVQYNRIQRRRHRRGPLCIFVFFKVGNVTFTSDAGYDEADIRRCVRHQRGR